MVVFDMRRFSLETALVLSKGGKISRRQRTLRIFEISISFWGLCGSTLSSDIENVK
jgi:hypothetical protein